MSPASSHSSGTCHLVSTLGTILSRSKRTTFSPFNKKVRLYGTLPLCPTIHASGLALPDDVLLCEPLSPSMPPGGPPKRPLFLRSFLSLPSELGSKLGVPGRLLAGEDAREGTSSGGGGSSGSRSAGSTGWMVGLERDT